MEDRFFRAFDACAWEEVLDNQTGTNIIEGSLAHLRKKANVQTKKDLEREGKKASRAAGGEGQSAPKPPRALFAKAMDGRRKSIDP